MNKKRIILRLLVSIPILCVLLITYTWGAFKHWIGFLRYGGEWINYTKDDPKTIGILFELMKEQKK